MAEPGIYRVFVESAPWATVIVRALDEDAALRLGQGVAEEYTGSRDGVTVERIYADGPPEVLIVDWS